MWFRSMRPEHVWLAPIDDRSQLRDNAEIETAMLAHDVDHESLVTQ